MLSVELCYARFLEALNSYKMVETLLKQLCSSFSKNKNNNSRS